jgi:hypothetical protein
LIWTSGWDKKILGFAVSLVARRPMRPIFDSVQLWFAENRAGRRLRLHWYHPPTFQARYNAVVGDGAAVVPRHGRLESTLMVGMLVVGVGLAGFGAYVLTYVANG